MPPKFFGQKRNREEDGGAPYTNTNNTNNNGNPRGSFHNNRGQSNNNADNNNAIGFSGPRRDFHSNNTNYNNNNNNYNNNRRSFSQHHAKKDYSAVAAENAAAHGYTFVEKATSEAAVTFFNAVKEGHSWKVKSLLDRGAKEFINAIDWQGYAPLHYASARIPISETAFSKPSANLVTTLLEVEGVNVEIRDVVPRNHATPLYHAVVSGSCNTISALLAFHSETAAAAGLPAHVDVNAISNKCTPLARAALIGDFEKFRLLLNNTSPAGGADPTISSATGITPLHCAADQTNLAIIDLLLKDGRSDVNARSGTAQRTVFMCASSPVGGEEAAARAPEAIKMLLAHVGAKGEKVDFNARTAKGQTALHIAATWGQTHSIPALCAIPGVDVNAKDSDGRTPLHCAMGASEKFPPHLATVEALLKVKGIDMDAVDNNGKTPLQLCQGKKLEDEVEEAFNAAKRRNR